MGRYVQVLKIILMVAVFAAGGAALWRGWAGFRPVYRGSAEPVADSGALPPAASSYDVNVEMLGAENAAAALGPIVGRARTVIRGGAGRLPDPAGFDTGLVTALRSYLGDSPAILVHYFNSVGIEPPDNWRTPEGPERAWEQWRSQVAAADLSTAGVVVRPRMVGGRQVRIDESRQMTFSRDQGRPFMQKVAAEARPVYEVVIPARLTSQDGTSFDGRLGVHLGWDPTARRWVLVGMSIYDFPLGVEFAPPPL